jgi:hypothetical protein
MRFSAHFWTGADARLRFTATNSSESLAKLVRRDLSHFVAIYPKNCRGELLAE